jgi:hypothetical protein
VRVHPLIFDLRSVYFMREARQAEERVYGSGVSKADAVVADRNPSNDSILVWCFKKLEV